MYSKQNLLFQLTKKQGSQLGEKVPLLLKLQSGSKFENKAIEN